MVSSVRCRRLAAVERRQRDAGDVCEQRDGGGRGADAADIAVAVVAHAHAVARLDVGDARRNCRRNTSVDGAAAYDAGVSARDAAWSEAVGGGRGIIIVVVDDDDRATARRRRRGAQCRQQHADDVCCAVDVSDCAATAGATAFDRRTAAAAAFTTFNPDIDSFNIDSCNVDFNIDIDSSASRSRFACADAL